MDKALVTRLEEAESELTRQYVEAYALVFPGASAATREVAGGRVSFAGTDSPLSSAEAVGLGGALRPRDLDAIEEFLGKRGAPSTLDLCPFTDDSVFRLAGQRRYRIAHVLSVFASSLLSGGREDYGPAGVGRDVDVRPISKGAAEAEDWCRTVGRGFASMESGDPPYMDIYRGIFHATGTTGYLAYLNGELAGAGALKIIGNVAYLSTASTLPRSRRKGVQMALMIARLREARRRGCELAAVVTSPGSDSERNVLRAGFSASYPRIRLVRNARAARRSHKGRR